MLQSENDILKLIENDDHMMKIIYTASTLNLPDWWICAGFVRSKIWDALHGYTGRTSIPDVDVIYFDEENTSEAIEKSLENELRTVMPDVPWSVKNQARMHTVNHISPYTSCEDAISKFPETATALGVKLDQENRLVLTAPCGLEDVLHFEVKPTPFFKETEERAAVYEARIVKKNWQATWHKVKVHHIDS